jgi:2-hydroxymuconate-semialdehyde hydrolase
MNSTDSRARMLAGVAVTPRTLDVDGISTAVNVLGDGPPLLLLHGGIECGGAMWAPVLDALSRHHRVVVPDAPGLGESAPLSRLDVDSFGRWLTAVIEQTELDRPALVAHSLLGSVATRFVNGGAAPVSRLVVSGAPGVGPYRMPWRLRYVAIRFAVRPTAENAERFDRFALLDLDATRRRDPEWFEAFEAYTRAQAQRAHVKKTMQRLVSLGTKRIPDDELSRMPVPTALLWGRGDRMVPIATAEQAAARHGWPLQVVEGAAHAPHVEQPERFVESLTTLLAG